MKTIKVKTQTEIPDNFAGIVEFENEDKYWYKSGKTHREVHREDGPAVIWKNSFKQWWLDDCLIWYSGKSEINLTKCIILSKEPHPLYPTCQVWKYIDQYGIKEQIVIPGMEAWITE